jgi:hypothetical protein
MQQQPAMPAHDQHLESRDISDISAFFILVSTRYTGVFTQIAIFL